MDIEIHAPVNITLDVIGIDEHIPSIQFEITIRIRKFGYNLDVNSKIWMECQCFCEFINNMRNNDIAILKDIDGHFELLLDSTNGWFKWLCEKESLDGYITLVKGQEKLTDEMKGTIYEAFDNYPKWW